MAIRCCKNRFDPEQGKWIKDYVMDGAADAASLPDASRSVGAGSTAHYGGSGSLVLYELSPEGTWVQIAGTSS